MQLCSPSWWEREIRVIQFAFVIYNWSKTISTCFAPLFFCWMPNHLMTLKTRQWFLIRPIYNLWTSKLYSHIRRYKLAKFYHHILNTILCLSEENSGKEFLFWKIAHNSLSTFLTYYFFFFASEWILLRIWLTLNSVLIETAFSHMSDICKTLNITNV